uniref:Uncharacterized protein n=1 Tax=viral metagenome TaxID=1070528 RepID=A0A6C0J7V3_9ZZZZ
MEDSNELYEQLKKYLDLKLQKPFNVTKVSLLLANGLKFVSRSSKLSDEQIRDITLRAVRDVVHDSDKIDMNDKQQIFDLLDLIGADVVDKLIDLAKNTYTFLKKNVFRCCYKENKRVSSVNRSLGSSLGNTNDELDKLKNYLKLKLNQPINACKIVGIIASGVKFIEAFQHLSGTEKKSLVINSLHEVITDSNNIKETDKTELLTLIDIFADDYIDLLVEFGRDKLKIFNSTNNCFKCCK